MDQMVYEAQKWLNTTYGSHPGYKVIEEKENGRTGWPTMYALTRALQIELNIATPVDSFGPTTLSRLENLGPISMNSNTNSNIVKIIQSGLYCKGYGPGAISGVFGPGTNAAMSSMKVNMGITNADGTVTPKVFKALLTMDAYVLLAKGNSKVRTIQQWLNRKYIHRKNFFYMPCDGFFSRDVQKALIYTIQYEEGLDDATANGNFGPTTQRLLPVLSLGSNDGTTSFVHLFQAAMIFNGYDVPFNGEFSQSVTDQVKSFQSFTKLSETGKGNFQTWASLLVSTGDPSRIGTAADCITEITPARAKVLRDAEYVTVGRYLSNVPGSSLNKKIQPGEIQTIFDAGLTIFPIYQTYGGAASYFNAEQGRLDGEAAFNAAKSYGFKKDTIIYFAVDFDALGYHITDNILPHFRAINKRMLELGAPYKIGIYGPRSVCSSISEKGLAVSSFVSGMSTGFSGNLGYPLPKNWAFDQISTISFGSGSGYIEIDNNINSGRYRGESSVGEAKGLNDDFFIQLGKIQLLAEQFSLSDIWDANYLVTQYYRHKSYNDFHWPIVGGVINQEFVDYVNSAIGEQEFINIIDPVTRLKIGIEHEMATLSALIYGNLPIIGQYIKDYGGWAGDLIQVWISIDANKNSDKYNGDVYKCALDYIGTPTSPEFSFDDWAGDIDAVNIAKMWEEGNHVTLYNAFLSYYKGDVLTRNTRFFETRFNKNKEFLRATVHEYVYGGDVGLAAVRYVLKDGFNVPDMTNNEAYQLAEAFIDVLLDRVEKETY